VSTNDRPVVRTEQRGTAFWIFIDRQERRNAINPEVIAGIEAALHQASNTPHIRVAVLTGMGDKAFCAGADLSLGTGVFGNAAAEPTTDFGRLARVAERLRFPMIARVNGACIAGGMGLLAMCDLAVAADHARFGLPEAKVGVFPMQVLVYLRKLIPPRHVNELCLMGDLVNAARACQMGLVNTVVPMAELDAEVNSMVERISACSPTALHRGRLAIQAMDGMPFHSALSYAETQITATANTPDAQEGLAAFNERRPPRWAPQPPLRMPS
jgi:methylglutaconyl-CoA hydratase